MASTLPGIQTSFIMAANLFIGRIYTRGCLDALNVLLLSASNIKSNTRTGCT